MIIKGMYFFCDQKRDGKPCDNGYFSQYSLQREATVDARRNGWVVSQKEECICPECQKDPEVIKSIRGKTKRKILDRLNCTVYQTDDRGHDQRCNECDWAYYCSSLSGGILGKE